MNFDIPKGLATKIGQAGAALFFALAVAIYAFDLDVNLEAMVSAGFAGVTLWTIMWGRYKQATAQLATVAVSTTTEEEVVPTDAGVSNRSADEAPSSSALGARADRP